MAVIQRRSRRHGQRGVGQSTGAATGNQAMDDVDHAQALAQPPRRRAGSLWRSYQLRRFPAAKLCQEWQRGSRADIAWAWQAGKRMIRTIGPPTLPQRGVKTATSCPPAAMRR